MSVDAFPRWTIDSEEITQRLRAAGLDVDRARPVYLRDKPGETAVVAYELTSGDHHERGYLRWFADPERAANDRHKGFAMAPTAGRLGPGVAAVGDHATMRILPNDARLRRARWYLTPRKLKRSLDGLDGLDGRSLSGAATAVQVLTYKPERRVVARLDLAVRDGHRRSVLLRYSTRGTACALAATAEHLRRHGVATARPVAQLEHGQVGLDEFLAGVDLRTAAADPRLPGLVDAVAAQIVSLHRTPAPPHATTRSRAAELATAAQTLRWLGDRGFADLDLAASARQLLVDTSERVAVGQPVLLHGDLHDRNIVVDPLHGSGLRASLIDLERVSIGDAAIDLGRLLASEIAGRLSERASAPEPGLVAAVVDVVQAADRRATTTQPALGFHLAMQLVAAALTAARGLETLVDPGLIDRLLRVAVGVLRDPEAIAELHAPCRPPADDLVDEPRRTRIASSSAVPVAEPTPPWMTEWPVAHPRAAGSWSVGDRRGWGRLDPERGHARSVDPADDPRLPALAHAMRRGELIGYRFGRRAVVATGHGFVKIVRPRRAAHLIAVHGHLAATSGTPAVPHVEAATDDGAIDLTVVAGRSLHDLIRRGVDDGVLADSARALASLHAGAPPAVLEAGEPDTAARWVGVVARAEPLVAESLAPIAACIDTAVAAAIGGRTDLVIVHGDCHDKNLFLGRAGPALIDLDGVRLGLREEDVANLAVHVALRAIQSGEPVGVALDRRDAVADAYGRSAPLDRTALAALERAVWFRLGCLYRFRSSGRRMVPVLLDLARTHR